MLSEWGDLEDDVRAEEQCSDGGDTAAHFRIDPDVARVDVRILRRTVDAHALHADAIRETWTERVAGGDVADAPMGAVGVEPRRRVETIHGAGGRRRVLVR